MENHAHELPEFLHFLEELIEEHSILRGFIFGLIHTTIPLIGFYTGWSINRLLKLVSNGAIAGIVGIVLGGFLPLLAVPFLEKYVTKSRYHTVVGDHEDLKKDLKKKHR